MESSYISRISSLALKIYENINQNISSKKLSNARSTKENLSLPLESSVTSGNSGSNIFTKTRYKSKNPLFSMSTEYDNNNGLFKASLDQDITRIEQDLAQKQNEIYHQIIISGSIIRGIEKYIADNNKK